MSLEDLYKTVATVTRHPISVNYITKEESYQKEKALQDSGDFWIAGFTSAIRSIGFGASNIVCDDNVLYPNAQNKSWRTVVESELGPRKV